MDASLPSETLSNSRNRSKPAAGFHSVTMTVAETQLVMLATRLLWWPEAQTLFMADSHFGKAATFRTAGIPVPAGTTQRMLKTLSDAFTNLEARRLIVLGDLVHSGNSSTNDFQDELCHWRKQHSNIEMVLVPGNHDRQSQKLFNKLDMQITGHRFIQGPFALSHAPHARDESGQFCLAGHIHPGVKNPTLCNRALPCFWVSARVMILPAFGVFTGLARINAKSGDAIYAIQDNEIHQIST